MNLEEADENNEGFLIIQNLSALYKGPKSERCQFENFSFECYTALVPRTAVNLGIIFYKKDI